MGIISEFFSKLMLAGREADFNNRLSKVNEHIAKAQQYQDETVNMIAHELANDKKFQEFLMNLPHMSQEEIQQWADEMAEAHMKSEQKQGAEQAAGVKRNADHENKKG